MSKTPISYSLRISFWTRDLALQQILSSIDLFLFYRTDYTDSQTMLNGCTGKCVRLSRPLVGFWTHFKSLHFHSFFHLFHFIHSCLRLSRSSAWSGVGLTTSNSQVWRPAHCTILFLFFFYCQCRARLLQKYKPSNDENRLLVETNVAPLHAQQTANSYPDGSCVNREICAPRHTSTWLL